MKKNDLSILSSHLSFKLNKVKKFLFLFLILFCLSLFDSVYGFTGKDGCIYPDYEISEEEQAIYLFDGTTLTVIVAYDNDSITLSKNPTTSVSTLVIANPYGGLAESLRTAYTTIVENGNFGPWISSNNISYKEYTDSTKIVKNTKELGFNLMNHELTGIAYHLLEKNLPDYIDIAKSNILCENLSENECSLYIAPANTTWILDENNKIRCRLNKDGKDLPFTKYNLVISKTSFAFTEIEEPESVTETTGTIDKIYSHFGNIIDSENGEIFSEDMRNAFNYNYVIPPNIDDIPNFIGKDGSKYPEYPINSEEQIVYLFDGIVLTAVVVQLNLDICYSENPTTSVPVLVIADDYFVYSYSTIRVGYSVLGEDGNFSDWIRMENFEYKDFSVSTKIVKNTKPLTFNFMDYKITGIEYHLRAKDLPDYIDLTKSNILCENLSENECSLYIAPANTTWILDENNKIRCRLNKNGEDLPFIKYEVDRTDFCYALSDFGKVESVIETAGTIDKIYSHFGNIINHENGEIFSEDMRSIFDYNYVIPPNIDDIPNFVGKDGNKYPEYPINSEEQIIYLFDGTILYAVVAQINLDVCYSKNPTTSVPILVIADDYFVYSYSTIRVGYSILGEDGNFSDWIRSTNFEYKDYSIETKIVKNSKPLTFNFMDYTITGTEYHMRAKDIPEDVDLTKSNILCENLSENECSLYVAPVNTVWVCDENNRIRCRLNKDGKDIPFIKYEVDRTDFCYALSDFGGPKEVTETAGTIDKIYSNFGNIISYENGEIISEDMRSIFDYSSVQPPKIEDNPNFIGKDGKIYPIYQIDSNEQVVYLCDGNVLTAIVVRNDFNISYSKNPTTLKSLIVMTDQFGFSKEPNKVAYTVLDENGNFSYWISSNHVLTYQEYSELTNVVGNSQKLTFNLMDYTLNNTFPYCLRDDNFANDIDFNNSNIICENISDKCSVYVAPKNTMWVLDENNKIRCRCTYDGENLTFKKYTLEPMLGASLEWINRISDVTETTGTISEVYSHYGNIVNYNNGEIFSKDMRWIFDPNYIPHYIFLERIRHFGVIGVDGYTGNYSNTYNDLKIEILNIDLSFTRTYNSMNYESGIFGRGWSFGFESKIEESPYDSTRMYVYLPNGSINAFIKKEDGTYEGENTRNKLEFVNNEYVLTTKDQTKYIFNGQNRLYKIIDKYSNVTEITVNNNGEITKIKDCAGREYTINYENGKITQIVDPLNRTITYKYNENGMLSEVIDVYGKSTYYEYDQDGYMLSEKIKNSGYQIETLKEMTYIENDSYKKLSTITDNSGKKDIYTYNNDNSTSIQDQNGRVTKKYYDQQGYCIKTIEPNGLETITNYNLIDNVNKFGEIIYQKENTGNTIIYERDNNGNITKQINVDNSYKTYEYNAQNNITKEIDENGNIIMYEYYPDGVKLKSKTLPSGTKTTYEYSDSTIKGLISKEIDLENNQTQYEYDNFGNTIKTIDGNGNIKTFSYNNIGWKISETDSNNNTISYEYNNAGQVTKTIRNNGESVEINVYNNKGELIKTTNPNENSVIYLYNTGGDLIQKTDEGGNIYSYEYDIYHNKVKEVLPNNVVYKYEYDDINRIKKKVIVLNNKDITLEEYFYEYNNGNKKITSNQYMNETDFSTSQIEYNYLDKIISEKREDAHKKYNYLANGLLSYEEDAIGKRTYYLYNADNNLITIFEEIENNEYKRTDYEYDILGNKVKEKVVQVFVGLNETSENYIEKIFEYDANGNVIKETHSTGQEIKNTYDGNNNIIKQEEKMEEDKYQVTEYEYNYENNITKKSELINKNSLDSVQEISEDNIKVETIYEYDNMQNLIKEISPGGIITKYTYNNLNKQIKKETIKGDKTITEENQYDSVGNNVMTKDGNSNITTFEYNELNYVTKKIQSNNIITQYDVDFMGNVIKEVFPNQVGTDNCTKYEYNKNGFKTKRIKQNSETADIVTLYSYDKNGNLLSEVTGDIGKSYTYNKAGQVSTFTDENGNKTTYEYDINLNLITETNAKNIKTTYTYDENNNELTKKISDVIQEENTYDLIGNLKSSKNELGKEITYVYDNNSNLIKQIDQYETQYKYDLDKNMVHQIDSNQKEIKYVYDVLGNVVEETEQKSDGTQSIIIKTEYDNLSNKIKEIDGNGNITEYTYDIYNNVTSTKNPANQTTIYEYDKNGNIIKETDYLQNTKTYVYDSLDRLIEKINEYGQTIEKLEYDIYDRQTKTIDANNNTIEYTYDNVGNILSEKDEEGNIEYYEYDIIGNKTKYTDKNGNVTKYFYTDKNELSKVENSLGEITEYTYDNAGNITEQKDPTGIKIKYEYDVNGNQIKEIDQNENEERSEYNNDNTLKKNITKNGDVFLYEYDIHGRLIKEIAGEDVIEYVYDNNNNLLKTIKNNIIETTRTYDNLNRVLTKNNATYEYDIVLTDGEYKEKSIDDKGNIVETIYDKAKRIKNVINEEETTIYNYNVNGSLNNITYPNGTKEEYVYNPDNSLQKLTNKNADNTIISEYLYEYDENNNITKKIDEKGTTIYQYDALNRLNYINGDGKITTYTYDSRGNRISENTTNGGNEEVTVYEYNNRNQLTKKTKVTNQGSEAVEYEYDLNGNQIKEKINRQVVVENTYDAKNQLIEINNGSSIAIYEYNIEGKRNKKIVDNVVTQFIYEGSNLILELDENGNEIAKNVYGLALISRNVGNDKGYYLYNGHGDVEKIIDSNNAELAKYYYDAFGVITEETGTFNNPWRYSGYYYDNEANNYYLQSRYYDPEIARFLSEDTYRGDIKDVLSLNYYTYAKNNPLIYTDPDGHLPIPLLTGLIGGATNTLFNLGLDLIQGNELDWRSYFGDFAEGFIIGGAFGLLGPEAGTIKTMATGFISGFAGNSTNQLISTGKVDWKEAFVSGATIGVGVGSFNIGGKIESTGLMKIKENAFRGFNSGVISNSMNQLLTKDIKEFDPIEALKSGGIGFVTTPLIGIVESIDNKLSNVNKLTKKQQLSKNSGKGKKFEKKHFPKLDKKIKEGQIHITLESKNGYRTIVDKIGIDKKTNNIIIYELKSSQKAKLTKNQAKAFPDIFLNGATVKGKGKGDIFTNGFIIPVGTKVEILRPTPFEEMLQYLDDLK